MVPSHATTIRSLQTDSPVHVSGYARDVNLLTHHWLFNFNARGVGKAHSLFAGVPAQLGWSSSCFLSPSMPSLRRSTIRWP